MNNFDHHHASLSVGDHRLTSFGFSERGCPTRPRPEDVQEPDLPSVVDIDVGGQAWKARFERLTSRERDVLYWIVEEKLSKQIADLLGISRKTVDFHRAHLMQKLQARSLVHLVKMAVKECVI